MQLLYAASEEGDEPPHERTREEGSSPPFPLEPSADEPGRPPGRLGSSAVRSTPADRTGPVPPPGRSGRFAPDPARS
jgi:hypothetical protein